MAEAFNRYSVRLGVLGILNVIQVITLPMMAVSKHEGLPLEALIPMAVAVTIIVISIPGVRAPLWSQRIAAFGFIALPAVVLMVGLSDIWRMR